MRRFKNLVVDKKVLYIGAMATGLAYTLFVIYFSQFAGLDADKANHILQAHDILQGNFWLRDWNLTGVTFFTTDLLYYELALLITGSVGYRTAYVAYGLMFLSVIVLSMFTALYYKHENIKPRIILVLCLLSVPCMNYFGALRTHSGAICWSIIAILLTACVLNNESKNALSKRNIVKYVLVFLSLLLGNTGDMLTALEGAIPIFLYCFITILNSPEKNRTTTDKRTYLMIAALAAIVGSIAIDRLYFYIGGSNKNSYIGYRQFSSVGSWQDKVWSFFSNLLFLGDAGFANGRLNDIWSYTKIINGLIIAVGVVLIIFKLWRMIRGNDDDIISTILSLSFIIIACAYIFTDKSHFKYMTIGPVICYIVVIREYENIVSFMKNRRMWISLIYILAMISFFGKIEAITHYNYPKEVAQYQELADFLNEHDLHYGYSSFWNASVIPVVSDKNVNVRHIMRDGKGRFMMYNWFNKNQWYLEDTNFILVDNMDDKKGASDSFGLSEENIVAYFGTPSERYECSGYIILVYDNNLSKYLVGIEDGKITPFEMMCNDKVDTEGEGVDIQFHLHKGGMVNGPYITIIPGRYSLVFEGNKLENVRVDVYSETENRNNEDYDNRDKYGTRLNENEHYYRENHINYQVISQTNDTIVVEFMIDKRKVEDVEFRMFCDDDGVLLDQISISKVI